MNESPLQPAWTREIILEHYGPRALDLFEKAAAAYLDWNDKINVISRKDTSSIAAHHFLHSLAIDRYLRFESASTVLDLGTGGGFPGVPLAIVRPDVRFTLCDSIAKKVRVASAVCEELGLSNASAVCARVEALPGQWDYVVTRAVASLATLWPWIRGRYRRGLLCLKGGDISSEISDFVRQWHIDPTLIHTWPVTDVYEDEYFREKFVIHIEKT